MNYRIYCDGSCRGNGSENAVGAWGYIIITDEDSIVYHEHGVEYNTTNQRMELQACIMACDRLFQNYFIPNDRVYIYTDSAYLHNCYAQGWYRNWRRNGWVNAKKQAVANRDLWERLIPYFENIAFSFTKVKGHVGHSTDEKWNDYVDNIVQSATLNAKNGGGIGEDSCD